MDLELDLTSERVVDDLTDLVESIYNDQVLFPGKYFYSSIETLIVQGFNH
jgi:hypothetical protein